MSYIIKGSKGKNDFSLNLENWLFKIKKFKGYWTKVVSKTAEHKSEIHFKVGRSILKLSRSKYAMFPGYFDYNGSIVDCKQGVKASQRSQNWHGFFFMKCLHIFCIIV